MEGLSISAKALSGSKSSRSASASAFKERFSDIDGGGPAAASISLPPLPGAPAVSSSSYALVVSSKAASSQPAAKRGSKPSQGHVLAPPPPQRPASEPGPADTTTTTAQSEAPLGLGVVNSAPRPRQSAQQQQQENNNGMNIAHRASAPVGAGRRGGGPVSMTRAKAWSVEVENSFRLQLAGFQDLAEYEQFVAASSLCAVAPEGGGGGGLLVDRWVESGFIKCLQNKKTGFFMYFRPHRECEDKYVNRVKIYTR